MRFLTDENFNGRILRGIQRELPDVNVLRVQDTVMYQSSDPQLLEWAAQEGRILLTHDIETLVGFANERVTAAKEGIWMQAITGSPHLHRAQK